MDEFDFLSGEKIAKAIDARIVSVSKQVYNSSPMNKSKYGRVTESINGLYSVVIDGAVYKKVPALSNVGTISKGDVVLCLIPNNQFSNIVIVGSLGDTSTNRCGLPLGMIVPVSVVTDDTNLHLADGSSLLQFGIYSQFCAWVKSRAIEKSENVPTCSIEEYASDMNRYGQCGKYVINDTGTVLSSGSYFVEANSIKLPTITEFVASGNNRDSIGDAELDEFKSHTHTHFAWAHTGGTSPSGVQYGLPYANNGNIWAGGSGGEMQGNYNAHTGGTETRPKNIRYPYYIVVATATKTDIQINLDNVTNEITAIKSHLRKTEQVDVVYNYSSSDPKINHLLTGGIEPGDSISCDLSGYDYLIYIVGEGRLRYQVNGIIWLTSQSYTGEYGTSTQGWGDKTDTVRVSSDKQTFYNDSPAGSYVWVILGVRKK